AARPTTSLSKACRSLRKRSNQKPLQRRNQKRHKETPVRERVSGNNHHCTSRKAIPIYVQSDQWNQLAPQDLSSIWRTIVNSFRYFDAPIPWLFADEEQFIFTFMKSGLSTLVFDGFDEYVLKNK